MKINEIIAMMFICTSLCIAGCGSSDEDFDTDQTNPSASGGDNVSNDDVVDNLNNNLILLSNSADIEYVVSPYGGTCNLVVGATNENAIELLDDIFISLPKSLTIDYTQSSEIYSGYSFVYNVTLTFPPNEEERCKYDLGKSIKGVEVFIQHSKPVIYTMSQNHSVPACGGALNDFEVVTSFYENGDMSDYYEEVYYSENKEEIISIPVRNKENGEWTPLVIAPNPTTEERIITINYGIRNIASGDIDKVTDFQVVQSGEYYVSVDKSIYTVPEVESELVIEVTSNANLQVSKSADWIEYLGVEKNRFKFKLTENSSGAIRDCDILFINSKHNVSIKLSVVQQISGIRTIHLDEPGTLADKISVSEMVELEAVAITGYIDFNDLETIRTYMTVLEFIDLSGLECNATINGYGDYVALGTNAFYNMTMLKRVILPEGMKEIPYNCFQGCISLESVNIPVGVERIQSDAFNGCKSLSYINIPITVNELGFAAFWGCEALESIIIPEGVTELPCSIFFECKSLKSVTLPSSLVKFREIMSGGRNGSQFALCSSLESIILPENITVIPDHAFLYCSKLKSINLDNIIEFGEASFSGCKALKSFNFSSDLHTIGEIAFEDCIAFTTIDLPIGLTYLGDGAFSGCTGISQVEIPATIKAISYGIFEGCTLLSNVIIPKSITKIGANAFKDCCIKKIVLPENLRVIDVRAFENNAISEIIIPDNVETIENYAFKNNKIKALNIPGNVKEIGSYAFANNGIEELTLNDGLQKIGNYAFYENDFEFLRIPESVTEIGSHAFAECQKMKSAIIKANITTLQSRTFFNCIDLVKLQLPKTLTTVEDQAFSACQQVRYIYSEAVVPPTGEGMRPLVWAFITVYVPSDLEEIYLTADSWFNDSYEVRSTTEFAFDFSQLDFEP